MPGATATQRGSFSWRVSELLDNAEIAALRGTEQAARLAEVIARTGLDPWDAHVAAVADAAICPILALDAVKWRQHSTGFDEPCTSSRSPTPVNLHPDNDHFLAAGTGRGTSGGINQGHY